MPNRKYHTIRNAIVATVIGGLIVSYAKGWLDIIIPKIWSAISGLIISFMGNIQIPIWLFVLLSLSSFIGIFRLLIRWINAITTPKNPTWRDYNFDNFLGVNWRWTYPVGVHSDLTPYCPIDDTGLLFEAYTNSNCIALKCVRCKNIFSLDAESLDDAKEKVSLLIDQKVRSGSWREAI